jgi:hypothetical protein
MEIPLREKLVEIALEWERRYGVAPHITSAISEYDAAMLVKCSEADYCRQMQGQTAVRKGFDFTLGGKHYQVKANRPSGKPGSFVTLVAKASNYEWDYLVWILYTSRFEIQEAWLWGVVDYQVRFHEKKRLSPSDMCQGAKLA